MKGGKVTKPVAFTFKSDEKAAARPMGPVKTLTLASLIGTCCEK